MWLLWFILKLEQKNNIQYTYFILHLNRIQQPSMLFQKYSWLLIPLYLNVNLFIKEKNIWKTISKN